MSDPSSTTMPTQWEVEEQERRQVRNIFGLIVIVFVSIFFAIAVYMQGKQEKKEAEEKAKQEENNESEKEKKKLLSTDEEEENEISGSGGKKSTQEGAEEEGAYEEEITSSAEKHQTVKTAAQKKKERMEKQQQRVQEQAQLDMQLVADWMEGIREEQTKSSTAAASGENAQFLLQQQQEENKKIEEEKKKEEETEEEKALKEKQWNEVEAARNEGNAHLAGGPIGEEKLQKALLCYNKALNDLAGSQSYPLRHLVLGNRSLVYGQLNKWHLALRDAIESTKLEKTYVKSYYRAVGAMQQLRAPIQQRILVLKHILKLAPGEVQVKQLLKEHLHVAAHGRVVNVQKHPQLSHVFGFIDNYVGKESIGEEKFEFVHHSVSEGERLPRSGIIVCDDRYKKPKKESPTATSSSSMMMNTKSNSTDFLFEGAGDGHLHQICTLDGLIRSVGDEPPEELYKQIPPTLLHPDFDLDKKSEWLNKYGNLPMQTCEIECGTESLALESLEDTETVLGSDFARLLGCGGTFGAVLVQRCVKDLYYDENDENENNEEEEEESSGSDSKKKKKSKKNSSSNKKNNNNQKRMMWVLHGIFAQFSDTQEVVRFVGFDQHPSFDRGDTFFSTCA